MGDLAAVQVRESRGDHGGVERRRPLVQSAAPRKSGVGSSGMGSNWPALGAQRDTRHAACATAAGMPAAGWRGAEARRRTAARRLGRPPDGRAALERLYVVASRD